jgi:hypothetical protein
MKSVFWKNIFFVSLVCLIELYSLLKISQVNRGVIYELNENDKSRNQAEWDDDKAKTKYEPELLISLNFIANPHFFPDHGLNIHHQDPYGTTFENLNNISNQAFIAGRLSAQGREQTKNIAEKIYKSIGKYLKINNSTLLSRAEFVTISIRLNRSIETAKILNEELYRLNNLSFKDNKIIKFAMNNFNSTLSKNDIKKIQEDETISTYVLPADSEKTLLPLNFHLKNCKKMKDYYADYKKGEVLKFFMTNFANVINGLQNLTKNKIFEKTLNHNYINYLNFTDIRDLEKVKILTDYYLSYQVLKNDKNFKTISQESNWNTNNLLFSNYSLFDVKTFDAFYVKNVSDDFMKIYLNGLFKFLLRIIYSKLDPSNNDLNSRLKVLNLVVHEFNLAGILRSINPNWGNISEILNLPKINYGSLLTIDIIQNKSLLLEGDSIVNSLSVNITFEGKSLYSLKLTEFLDKVNNYIFNDDNFYEILC